jgi:RNA polymerase sigma-70 factor (ECF subfamily)
MHPTQTAEDITLLSDKDLVLQIQQDLPHYTKSFEELTKRHHNTLFSICLKIIGDSFLAEDAYQNSMIKIFRYIHNFNLNSSFKTWAYRIAFNESISVKNAHKDELETLRDYESYEHSNNLDNELEVERLLQQVGEEERQILVLKYTVELSDKEIAEVMDISLSALKMRLSRAKQKLQSLLEK